MGLPPKHLLGGRSGPVAAQTCAIVCAGHPQGDVRGYVHEGRPLLAGVPRKRQIPPRGAHPVGVTTALVIALVLAAWLVVPLPLAVLVGRWMRAGGVTVPDLPAPIAPI